YEFDLDRDGFPELVLENQQVRVAFSPHYGGRSTEFLLKQHRLNAFTIRGALQETTPLEGRIVGPGQIELRSGQMTRRISLGPRDNFFEVEQTGGSGVWLLSTHGLPQFTLDAPTAQIETDRKPFSTLIRVKFPEGSPGRARFSLEPPAKTEHSHS